MSACVCVFQSANMLIVVNNSTIYTSIIYTLDVLDYYYYCCCCYNTVCFPFLSISFIPNAVSAAAVAIAYVLARCLPPRNRTHFVRWNPEDLLNGFCHKCCVSEWVCVCVFILHNAKPNQTVYIAVKMTCRVSGWLRAHAYTRAHSDAIISVLAVCACVCVFTCCFDSYHNMVLTPTSFSSVFETIEFV